MLPALDMHTPLLRPRIDSTTVHAKQVFETEILQLQFQRFKPAETEKRNARGKSSSLNFTESPEGGGACYGLADKDERGTERS